MLEITDSDRTLQSMVPENMKRWTVRPCTSCEGSGRCPKCKDAEKRRVLGRRLGRKAAESCLACGGNRSCRTCAGTGRVGGVASSQPVPPGPTSQPPELTKSERVSLVLDLLTGRTSIPACRDRGLRVNDVVRWVLDFLEAGGEAIDIGRRKSEVSIRSRKEPIIEPRERLSPIIGRDV
jgi:hypothetical protein